MYEIRKEDVELVALDNFRRRVVMVIMGLVVLVPLIPSVYTVEVLGPSGPVLVMPPIHLCKVYFWCIPIAETAVSHRLPHPAPDVPNTEEY